MNDLTDPHDLETTARAAGAVLRRMGTQVADTDHAWAELVGRLATDVAVEYDRDRFDRRPAAHDHRRWLAVAASVVALVGLAATFVAVRNGSDAPADTIDAPSSRFLLPKPGSGYTASGGSVTEAELTADRLPSGTVELIGTATGDGSFETLLQVSVTDEPPLPAGAGCRTRVTSGTRSTRPPVLHSCPASPTSTWRSWPSSEVTDSW